MSGSHGKCSSLARWVSFDQPRSLAALYRSVTSDIAGRRDDKAWGRLAVLHEADVC